MRRKWDFKQKYDKNGVLARYKARIIVLENTPCPRINYDTTYAPVVKIKSICLLMAMAAEKGWDNHHNDIVAAYLIAKIDYEIVMEVPANLTKLSDNLPETFPDMPSKKDLMSGWYVCKLNKSLYGLHQSGRIWNYHIDNFLKRNRLKRTMPARPVCILQTRCWIDHHIICGWQSTF